MIDKVKILIMGYNARKAMDKQYKIIKKYYVPQIIIGLIIASLFTGFIFLNNKHDLIAKPYLGSIGGICTLIIALVFVFFNNRKTLGLLKFDDLGLYMRIDNSDKQIYFLDDKLLSLRIKLIIRKEGRFMMYPMYYSNKSLNKLELQYIDKKVVYLFEVDSLDDYRVLINNLKDINEKAKLILN